MSEHNLKIAPVYFDAVADGSKTVELRKDDRGYDVDDTLVLREFQPAHWCHGEWIDAHYTGRECRAVVTHITTGDDWLQPGIVALSICTEASRKRTEALERLWEAAKWRKWGWYESPRDDFEKALDELARLEADT